MVSSSSHGKGGCMFKRILVPTDGSDLSAAAGLKAVEFAKAVGASVCAFHAFSETGYSYSAVEFSPTMTIDRDSAEHAGRSFLSVIEAYAREAGVRCDSVLEFNTSAYRAIVDAAETHHCDLIFMGSHGRSAVSTLLIGSVTQQVMSHSFIPVLVFRDERGARGTKGLVADAHSIPSGLHG